MVIVVCKPDTAWLPIWKAPLLIQAALAPRQPFSPPSWRLLPEQEIAAFIQQAMADNVLTGCRVDFDSGTLMLSYPSPRLDDDDANEFVAVEPFAAKQFCKDAGGAIIPGYERLFEQWESMWAEMERRFRSALSMNQYMIVARPLSLHNPEFTEISHADFALYRIIDWKLGVSENEIGDRIYSIHLAPRVLEAAPTADEEPLTAGESAIIREWGSATKAAVAARHIYNALKGDDVPQLAPIDHAMMLNGINDPTITSDFRVLLGRLCHPERPITLSYDTAKKARMLAQQLRATAPSRRVLNLIGL